jgi:hypothetical protein
MSAERMARLINSLDPVSRSRLRMFKFKLLLVVVFSILFAARGFSFLVAMSLLCVLYSLLSGAAALTRSEKIGATVLNGWDEMASFIALALLMDVFARVSS